MPGSKLLLVFLSVVLVAVFAKKTAEKPEWAKKDIRDFTDADMERLLDQWEEDEEPLPEDELPEYLRKPPKIELNFDKPDAEAVLKASKKGRTLMTFVTITGDPTQEEGEEITKLWQSSLWNNHIQAERYMVDTNRAIFLFKDGSQAWEAKDFLVEQERCDTITIDNKVYPGKKNLQKIKNQEL